MDQERDNLNSTPQKLLVTGLINLSFVFLVSYLINLFRVFTKSGLILNIIIEIWLLNTSTWLLIKGTYINDVRF